MVDEEWKRDVKVMRLLVFVEIFFFVIRLSDSSEEKVSFEEKDEIFFVEI